RINMRDNADTIAKKFKKAKTDSEPLPDTLDGLKDRPEARNLVDIYAALSDTTSEAVIGEYAGAGWGRFKPALADLAVDKLAPISDEMTRLMDDPAEIDRILANGAERARAIAAPILARTYDIVGLLR
ncbi:MAG: tryptophan--tRNA ligase, partial [Alphaproteobacteria bacterium]|nr:tryptophan--tRNA ligase [Alphaproteobacteria bacterium]